MLIASKKTPLIPLTIWPTVSPLPLKMVFNKIASIVLKIILEPKFCMLVLFPARDIKKIRPGTMPIVITPFTNV